jgi:hypothetical protein
VRAKRGHALFHAIVTMGAASVQACGGVAVDGSHAGDGQGTGSRGGDGPGSADTGGARSSSSGTATSPPFPGANGDGGSTATSPSGGSYGYLDAGSAGAVGIGGNQFLDGGSPSMCAHPQQFQCMTWDPTPQDCRCDPNAPLTAADCPSPQTQLYCHSYTPQVGCYCTCVICIH